MYDSCVWNALSCILVVKGLFLDCKLSHKTLLSKNNIAMHWVTWALNFILGQADTTTFNWAGTWRIKQNDLCAQRKQSSLSAWRSFVSYKLISRRTHWTDWADALKMIGVYAVHRSVGIVMLRLKCNVQSNLNKIRQNADSVFTCNQPYLRTIYTNFKVHVDRWKWWNGYQCLIAFCNRYFCRSRFLLAWSWKQKNTNHFRHYMCISSLALKPKFICQCLQLWKKMTFIFI